MAEGSSDMDANSALAFAAAVSLFSIFVIVGTALMGAYRFFRNMGIFRGHYYY
jgi:hypothetical protein